MGENRKHSNYLKGIKGMFEVYAEGMLKNKEN